MSIEERVARRYVAQQQKQAAKYDFPLIYKAEVRKMMDRLHPVGEKILARVARILKKHKLEVSGSSYFDWEVRSSDGLRVQGELYFKDVTKDVYRSTDEIRDIFEAEFDMWVTPQERGNTWVVDFGEN